MISFMKISSTTYVPNRVTYIITIYLSINIVFWYFIKITFIPSFIFLGFSIPSIVISVVISIAVLWSIPTIWPVSIVWFISVICTISTIWIISVIGSICIIVILWSVPTAWIVSIIWSLSTIGSVPFIVIPWFVSFVIILWVVPISIPSISVIVIVIILIVIMFSFPFPMSWALPFHLSMFQLPKCKNYFVVCTRFSHLLCRRGRLVWSRCIEVSWGRVCRSWGCHWKICHFLCLDISKIFTYLVCINSIYTCLSILFSLC